MNQGPWCQAAPHGFNRRKSDEKPSLAMWSEKVTLARFAAEGQTRGGGQNRMLILRCSLWSPRWGALELLAKGSASPLPLTMRP